MSGLTATLHGMPQSMRGVATGLMVLIGLVLAGIAITLGAWIHALGMTPPLLQLSLLPLVTALIWFNQRHSSQVLSRLHRILRGYLLPTRESVTVVELTPKQLLINTTASLPRVIPTAEIRAVQREQQRLILVGPQPPVTLDASLNSAAALVWLEAELSRIIVNRGEEQLPPAELQAMLQRAEPPKASR